MAHAHDQLEGIIDRIREARNFDFRNYKRATLRRRIERRMADRRVRTVRDYVELLERSPEEFDALISSMLIKVTAFFRDPEAWSALARKALPELLARKAPGEEIRIWSVGCATGEETYSIAMVVAELLGPAISRHPVKIFGTDVDEAAVAFARRGVYTAAQLQGVSRERIERFFTRTPEGFAVQKDLRRIVVFGVNNLVADAPISRLDVLLCRNVFIYFDSSLQKRILSRFHYGLRPGGLLFLGKSELIPFAAKLFEPIDLSRRIYGRSRAAAPVASDEVVTAFEQEDIARAIRQSREELSVLAQLHREVLNAVAVPVFTTAVDGAVTLWNAAAAELWGRPEADVIGRKVTALGLAGVPGDLLVEKTLAVRDGRADRRSAEGAIQAQGAHGKVLALEVAPIRDPTGEVVGMLYSALDVTRLRTLELELRQAVEERRSAVEDVQSTNEELQSANEELETTNEELQSANEELQTTNEELQSTNEELETTNEELQSTNAELDATNRELAHRTEELNLLNFYQKTIVRSLSAAVVVLDPRGRITLWNLAAERLLGLTETEAVGQLLWTLRIPVIDRRMAKAMRTNLANRIAFRADDISYERGVAGGRGHATLSAVPLIEEERVVGAVVILEDTTRAAQLAEERVREELRRGRRRAGGRGSG